MGEVKVEIKKETEEVDFSKLTLPEALKILNTDHHGLSSDEAKKRLAEYGPNKLPESKRIPILVFLGYMWNPLSWAMEAAAILAIILLDYADFALIVGLLLLNSTISYVEESSADKAIKALAAALAPKAKAVRDGTVQTIDSINLVPGDVIIIKFGDIVPADIKILGEEGGGGGEEVPMQVDQAALTGESLPVKKFTGDVAFSGSSIKQGERHCVVYATGVNTFFGRAAALISATNNVANLQIVMTKIGAICLITIGVWVVIELAVQFGHYDHGCEMGVEEGCPTLINILVILVGGIPIAMPTVLSVTLALGASTLAKEGAIVARMSAVEEMAGMDVLCSDKTGTLTLNKLSIEKQSVMPLGEFTVDDVMRLGALSTNIVTEEAIDMVLFNSYEHSAKFKETHKTTKYIPFNPNDKFTCATILEIGTGKVFRVLKGSPQVVLKKAYNYDEIQEAVNAKMVEFAGRGFRSLGVAIAVGDGVDGNDKWEMVGLLPLYDPPRHDTKDVIEKCHDQGIIVKMVTGDHLLIGKETSKMLGMGTTMFSAEVLIKAKNGDKTALGEYKSVTDMVERANGFAEVFPEHKYEIVEILQEADHVVGMTGDGVNDAPALKKADVGIAVHGATDAARGAADIVLTEPGLGAIATAIIGARKIFQRMTTYSKYTVAMTFRICFTFGLLTVIYDWYFPTILIVILAVFNDGAMIALSKDKVTPSRTPNSWNLKNIFLMGIVYGLYLTLSSWVLFYVATKMNFFEDEVGMFSLNDRTSELNNWCIDYIRDNLGGLPAGVTTTSSVCDVGPNYQQAFGNECGSVTALEQCVVEQAYVRGAMMRSLLYTQVSISGQAVVFVVRTQGYSLSNVAGRLTYVAFFAAQAGATLIGLFGFNGYATPPDHVSDCAFCTYSDHTEVLFWASKKAPMAQTESQFVASVIGCVPYVIVAWIWSAIWYMGLDPIKWALCYILNEDGFRDMPLWQRNKKHRLERVSKNVEEVNMAGMAPATYSNPLGRASLKHPVSHHLDRASAALVPIHRTSDGIARVSNDPLKAKDLARRSRNIHVGPNPGNVSRPSKEITQA